MRAVLFANGHLSDPLAARRRLLPDDLILCADGGSRHALALGLRPHLVIGDLDSLTAADRALLDRPDSTIEQHPTDKDATDLELALHAARRLGADEVLLLAALGGRLDQELANLLLLAGPQFADLSLSLADGEQTAWVVRDRLSVAGRPGDTVSALALSPQVEGLSYHGGLRWPLHDFTLAFGSSRGVSNEMTAPTAALSLRRGVLLVIHIPAHPSPETPP
jgi:thiamine pyrophosphokinase